MRLEEGPLEEGPLEEEKETAPSVEGREFSTQDYKGLTVLFSVDKQPHAGAIKLGTRESPSLRT